MWSSSSRRNLQIAAQMRFLTQTNTQAHPLTRTRSQLHLLGIAPSFANALSWCADEIAAVDGHGRTCDVESFTRARRLVSAPSLPPEAAKIIYRSMLKACANGRHPEVLKLDELNGEPLPHNPHGVVNLIRGSNAEPFASLKFAAECSRALHPPIGSLPQTLPAFVLPSHTLLPGEMADFVLSQRHVTLARQVLALGNKSAAASGAPPDYRYAHLPEPIPGGVGTITSILDHQELPDGRVFVRVLAGPRLIVTKTARVEKVGASPSSSADGGRAALRG